MKDRKIKREVNRVRRGESIDETILNYDPIRENTFPNNFFPPFLVTLFLMAAIFFYIGLQRHL